MQKESDLSLVGSTVVFRFKHVQFKQDFLFKQHLTLRTMKAMAK